ncbi:MAG: hypothetical protein IJH82_06755 [Lachnospiraceae bacterium]|nr:hypothetical protein [Lachnospiraceae bacterium]
MNIGGNLEKCPLCQNALTGEGERDYWPKITLNTKRTKAYKIVLFAAISVCIVTLAMDFLFLKVEHVSFSPIAVAWILVTGWILESTIKKHYNLLKTMFVSMITICVLCQITEIYIHYAWDVPYLGITAGWIVPILCSVNMVANFVLSFVDKQFTDHSLIYMFLNILVGVLPWIALFFYQGMPPLTWSVCLVINCLAFVALFVFKGKIAIEEFKKRFHV